MAEKVRTASIIAKKSLEVIWMNPIRDAGVLSPATSEGPAASKGPADAGSGSVATDGE